MKYLSLVLMVVMMTSCASSQIQPSPAPVATGSPQVDMPNPASVFCTQQGYQSEIRTSADGSQTGYCIFPDGSECDEWAYYRGECSPVNQGTPAAVPGEIPTARPIDPAEYQGWWTYTHAVYAFSIMLPEDWIAEEVTTFDSLMNGHTLTLHPEYIFEKESIRMTFRRIGEDVRLWPMGVGQGEFVPKDTLDVAGQPALRMLLVCPTGEVTSIWYHQTEGQPNIARGDLEFGFIFSAGPHCKSGSSLVGKVQHLGEMIIASLQVP